MAIIINTILAVLSVALLAHCQNKNLEDEIHISCDEENLKCYSLFKKTINWDGAIQLCERKGRHLAVINNECSQRLITELRHGLTPISPEPGHAWTALRRSEDVIWRYFDGDPFEGTIQFASRKRASCVTVEVVPGSDVVFTARTCYDDKTVPSILALCHHPTTPEKCKHPHYYEDNYCYVVPQRSFYSQVDARAYCAKHADMKDGSLAMKNLFSPGLQNFLSRKQEILTVKSPVWVGVERRPWAWHRDGKLITPPYTDWREYEGANSRENCMHVELKVPGHKWADKNCSTTSDYVICETGDGPQKTPFTFGDMNNGDYWPRGFYGLFHKTHDVFMYRDPVGHLVGRDMPHNVTNRIMDKKFLNDLEAYTYFVAHSFRYVLIAYDRTRVYRDSFTAKYKIFDRQNNSVVDFPNMLNMENSRLQYAQWSDSTEQLVFVYNNNVYYQHSPMDVAIQVTYDGKTNKVVNGIPDWMFEEDVLWSNKATYWSQSGRLLCFARFDVTEIPSERIPIYGDADQMYPDYLEYVVPKAGHLEGGVPGPTTKVDLFIFDTTNPRDPPRRLLPPSELRDQQHYYTSVSWVDDVRVYVTWTNRAMNRSITTICDVNTLVCHVNHDLVAHNGWVRIPAVQPWFTLDKSHYVTILPRNITGRGAWRHLAYVSANPGVGSVTYLTDGPQEITDIIGYDPELGCIYYKTTNGNPGERHVFRVGLPTARPHHRSSVCLTCGLDPDCLYSVATFSPSGTYYKLDCLGPGVPRNMLKNTRDTKWVETLEDNAYVKGKLNLKRLPLQEHLDIRLDDGTVLKSMVYNPPSMLPGRKYRMLFYVYGAPDSQDVTQIHPLGTYRTAWFTHLASAHDVIIVTVDARGTYGRGDDWRFAVYKQLGRRDVMDQIAAAKYFKTLPFINTTANAAVIGWSYGGMMSALALASESNVFQCGLAISAITSKRYYNRAYSERFLGFAHESTEAYDGTDVMLKAANFKGKKFFIAHGSKDENVQIRHMAALQRALTRENIQYKQMTYFDENHDLSSYYTTQHLYRSMTDFLLNDCWGGQQVKG